MSRKVGDRALRAAARPIVERAKRVVPVRTGTLRDSITAAPNPRLNRRTDDARGYLIGFRRAGGASRYAHLVEFGTAHSAAKPFMRVALDTQAGAAFAEMLRVLGEGAADEAEKLAGTYMPRGRSRGRG